MIGRHSKVFDDAAQHPDVSYFGIALLKLEKWDYCWLRIELTGDSQSPQTSFGTALTAIDRSRIAKYEKEFEHYLKEQ